MVSYLYYEIHQPKLVLQTTAIINFAYKLHLSRVQAE